MEYPLNQSAWRRGWDDTKKVWTSWPFFVLDAVVAVVIGGLFGWYWGLVIVVFGMICAWIGATVSAPIKQRNEARALLLAKPKPVPLRNRESLIRAIGAVKEKAIALKMRQDDLNFKEKHHEDPREELHERDNAWRAYLDTRKDLETERLVAGDHFKGIILGFLSFIDYHVDDCMGHIKLKNKREPLKTIPVMAQLEDYTEWTIRELELTNLRVPDNEGSQS